VLVTTRRGARSLASGLVRLGRVTRLSPEEIVLEHGTVASNGNPMFVDCSSQGIPRLPSTLIFDGDRITPQWIRTFQPTFSAAFVANVEAAYDDALENELCAPIEPPEVPLDYVRMFPRELATRTYWTAIPSLTNDGPAVEKLNALLGPL
jgi:hypothetical protein